ncbi:MAG: LysR family transcriptional regulator [Paracoccaceae bacterium]
MARNLDLTALRSFVAVADAGGVTRAAGLLNLTQSAVSMQIKRLEEALAQNFFSRAARKLVLTPEGEQLLGYARRMLALNDEVLSRLTDSGYEGELRLGVPCDIVYPQIPGILKSLAREFPRVRINLVSSFTQELLEGFGRGEFDMILTTEDAPGPGGEVLSTRDLVWLGAAEGTAAQRRPVRLGFVDICRFRNMAQMALDNADIPWEMGFEGDSEQVVEATVAADLAITARLRGSIWDGVTVIEAGNLLPELGQFKVCLYDAGLKKGEVAQTLLAQIRCAYGN